MMTRLILPFGVVAAFAVSAWAQIVPVTAPLEDELREGLDIELEARAEQIEVRYLVLERLKAMHDGSAASALRVNALLMMLESDEAFILRKTAPMVVGLRAADEQRIEDLKFEMEHKEREVREIRGRSDALLQELLDVEERLARETDDEVREDLGERQQVLQGQLEILLGAAEEESERREALGRELDDYKSELADLDRLDREIDAEARLALLRIDRLERAIRYAEGQIVAAAIEEKRSVLRRNRGLSFRNRKRGLGNPARITPATAIPGRTPIGDSIKKGRERKAGISPRLAEAIEKARRAREAKRKDSRSARKAKTTKKTKETNNARGK